MSVNRIRLALSHLARQAIVGREESWVDLDLHAEHRGQEIEAAPTSPHWNQERSAPWQVSAALGGDLFFTHGPDAGCFQCTRVESRFGAQYKRLLRAQPIAGAAMTTRGCVRMAGSSASAPTEDMRKAMSAAS